ncbi:hypothetical protein EB796_015115 [Bugula neritina]|uniref:Uncharacterized protein n=1 Tax=Bugula neritina TaxID=10212 RepID=A0A7J7JLS7_BUGNE|nr:hypothetical protein EB796_015115 [Bugula neritina]
MENSVKSLHGGNIQLQEARVLISKRDKQVAEFYLRLRNALLNKQKSSGKSEDTCDSESCLNSASSSRRSVNFRTRCEIVAVRHVPDGGCGSIGTALPISGLNYSSAFVPVLENLPELGMGIVDTPDDLVSETGCELTQDLYVSFELSSHDTSEVLIDLTSTSPEKYPYSDQLWGFSDSDPADWLFTEVRDFLEDCVETVSKFRRPKNSRPSKVVTINYGLLKAAVITGEVTEALSLIPPVKLLSASHTTVPSTLKHIPEGELFVEQVVHIPAPETLLVNSTLYRRNAGS